MSGQRQIQNLALIGFMGTGKSSVGRLVAAQLHFNFLDTDEMIETRAGISISEIFAHSGEKVFRELEAQLLLELSRAHHTVISTGGGLAANPDNLASLKQHALIVCLWASPTVIWERVRGQTHRPLLQGPEPLQNVRQLLSTREPVYKQADVLVNTEQRSIKDVAQHVMHQFHLARSR